MHSIPFAILRKGLIIAIINNVRGDSWEGRCSAARMPKEAKRVVICGTLDSRQTERRIANSIFLFLSRRLAAAEGSGPPSYRGLNTVSRFLYPRLTSPVAEKEILFSKLSHFGHTDINSQSDTTALFPPLLEKHSPHFKKPSVCGDTHIGHEEKYI